MILHYCEKCGFRIAPADVASGAAPVTEEGKATCTKCVPPRRGSAKVPAASAPRESGQDLKLLRRDTKINLTPAAPTTTTSAPSVRLTNTPKAESPSRKLLLIGSAVAVVLLLVALATMLGGSKADKPRKTAESEPDRTAHSLVVPPVPSPNIRQAEPRPPVETKDEVKKEPDEYNPRAAFAQSLLDQAKAAFSAAPKDASAYREKLKALVNGHGQTTAGKEAATILATLSPDPKPGEPVVTQTPKGGEKPGLWAKYYSVGKRNRKTFHFGRPLTLFEQDFGHDSPAKGVPATNYLIEMTGVLRVTEAGEYTFALTGDDALEFWLDGKSLARAVWDKPASCKIDLTAGDHPFKAVHVQAAGDASFKVRWKPPGRQDEETISVEHLFYLPEAEQGK